ncbi:MFS transporter [Tistrella mobilis]|uniref:MFS transporter n=1 Tax=Tistrella mobilis TaxID=171437 RepID=UPI0035591822
MSRMINPPGRHPGAALLAVCLAAAAMPLTFTGTAVALPAIARDLGGSPVALAWVTNAFMLTFGACLMAAGALADAHGRRRVFLAGTGGFALASLAAGLAPDILTLDLARAAQGLAAAAAFSGGMAALAQTVEGPARLRAFSLVGTAFGVGLAFGPIASGTIIDAAGWRMIFALVAALGLAACLAGARALTESRDPAATGLDRAGAVVFTLTLTLLTFATLRAPETGWSDPLVILLLAGTLAGIWGFIRIEARQARPMLDLSLFRNPRFAGVQLLAAAPAYGFVVLLVLLPVRFVGLDDMTATGAGRMMIALSAPLLVVPLLAGRAAQWISPARLCGGGLVINAAGLAWAALLPADAPPAALIGPLVTIGIGIGLPWGLMDGLAVSVVASDRAGMATGIFSTIRVAGEGIALAVVGALLSGLTLAQLAGAGPMDATRLAARRLVAGDAAAALAALPGQSHAALLAHFDAAFDLLLLILAAVTLATALVVFVMLGRSRDRAAACA